MTLILPILVVLLLMFIVSTYNNLVSARNKVEEAFSTMDVYMKKRFDLIPNLVAAVKGYAKHETETLENLVKLRSGSKTTGEAMQLESQISTAVRGLMVQVEAYPDLKANQNFLDLQKQLSVIEEDIAKARRYYNGSVRQYNTSCQQFPTNLLAGLFHFETKKMFEADEESRKPQQVSF